MQVSLDGPKKAVDFSFEFNELRYGLAFFELHAKHFFCSLDGPSMGIPKAASLIS